MSTQPCAYIPLPLYPKAECVSVYVHVPLLTLFLLFLLCSSAGRAGQTPAFSPSQEDSFHKPVKLAGVTSHGHLESDCEPELRQTLLSNGHTLRASQNESAPLRRASD